MKALSESAILRRDLYGRYWLLLHFARDALPGVLAMLALILLYTLIGAIEP